MTQRQLTNYKNNNLLILVGGIKVLPEIILNSGTWNIGEVHKNASN